MRRSTGFLLIVLALVAPSFVLHPAAADGVEGLGTSFHDLLLGGGVVSEGVGLAGRLSGEPGRSGTITIAGVPAGASVSRAFLYWAVLGNGDPTASFQGNLVDGTLIGDSVETWTCGLDHQARNYVYRADVTPAVAGNGTYAVSGVGDTPETDGQGASLVVLYEDLDASTTMEVVINDGAITGGNFGDGIPGGGFEDMSVRIDPLSIPDPPLSARLHVGFGDGQGTPGEDDGAGPLRFEGTQLAPAGFLSGTDGDFWDDQTFSVPVGLVAPGTQSASVTLNSGNDCILWAFTILELELPDSFGPVVRGVTDRAPNEHNWFNAPVTIHWIARDPNDASQPPDTFANLEQADHVYTSAPSCDSLGNCATGSLTVSIDTHAPNSELAPQEFLFFDESPIEGVQIFDQWIQGTATDALSGVATVRIVAENTTTFSTTVVSAELTCDQGSHSCGFRAQLPDDPGTYRVRITAIDYAGNEDASPAETIAVLPPNPFPDECPLGPLCD
ncbi:MAG: hypothetical protein ABR548_07305 [Actinomycetota bacterium]|nr:DUF3344 domain-containing protein [Actinomycetota bacterium]